MVTERAQSVGDEEELERPWQSALWGMMRSVGIEKPKLSSRLIDVWSYEDGKEALVAELSSAGDYEDEVCLRQEHKRYVNRLERMKRVTLTLPTDSENWQLRVSARGTFENLAIASMDRPKELGEHEVENRV